MNRRALAAVVLSVALPGSLLALEPAQAATRVPLPMKLVSATAPGPSAGSVTVSWKPVKSAWKPRTTGFRVETATTQFSPYTTALPTHGRNSHVFTVGAAARKLVLSAATMAKIGAPLASGNHLYVRVWSLDKKAGHPVRTYSDGQLHAVFPRGLASTGTGSVVRVADYNVRVAGQDAGTSHDWYEHRLPLVAKNIVDQAPGIVTLQEANPTTYTSSGTDSKDHTNTQLLTLRNAVTALSGNTWALVRSSYYSYSTGENAQQGERILYDTTQYKLLSTCEDTTKDPRYKTVYDYYNASCSVALPSTAPGSTVNAKSKRWAGYAQFEVISTGEKFWVVSIHLDNVGGTKDSAAVQRAGDDLRRYQVQTVLDRMAQLNTDHEPVVLAGDMNTYQNSKSPHGYAAHDELVRQGFYDTFAAASRSGYQYDTENGYGAHAARDKSGIGARIDTIMTQGIAGADNWKHVRFSPNGEWPSDHDMLVASVRLP